MHPTNLLHMLKEAATTSPDGSVVLYHNGTLDQQPSITSYQDLYQRSLLRSSHLLSKNKFRSHPIVLLHTDNYLDQTEWFWAIVAAGGIPCMSTAFTNDLTQRRRHIRSLQKLLNDPFILTTEALIPEFCNLDGLQLHTIVSPDFTEDAQQRSNENVPGFDKHPSDLAILMLTSGSTGDPKAVCLTHHQILSSLKGKINIHSTTSGDVFLGWTPMEHVANLVEVHLQAVRLSANQVHLPRAAVVAEPLRFLQKLSDYRVSYTFAPNSFLASVERALESLRGSETLRDHASSHYLTGGERLKLDLSNLRALVSGGEPNLVSTCVKLTSALQKYGAPWSFIRPGLGLTETCGGAVYSLDCPSYDILQSPEHCSVGRPMDGVNLRIMRSNGTTARRNEIGSLEMAGPAVFKGYFNNTKIAAASHTHDGWFKTGDLALLDCNGRLRLTGRDKDIIIINGVNHYPQAIEAVVESANIPGIIPSYTVVFGHRPKNQDTEVICIVYLPAHGLEDHSSHANTAVAISKSVLIYSGIRPHKIIPLEVSLLKKSSLGKLSRANIRKEFEAGVYKPYDQTPSHAIQLCKNNQTSLMMTPTEQAVVDLYLRLLPSHVNEIGLDTDIFHLGLSSIDLLTLQSRLQTTLSIPSISINTLLSHPVIRDLANILEDSKQTSSAYDPVVILQPHGTKTPLWFIHPGLGEIFIFMNLARYITDRPVYALRARGFHPGERRFSSLDEMVSVYHDAIKFTQPQGPYAFAGYSFGSILAFEITKRMQTPPKRGYQRDRENDEVKFLATFDQPPHFKQRARSYDYYEVLLSVAYFLSLISEEYAYDFLPTARTLTHEQVLDHVMELAPRRRMEELGMDRHKIHNWTCLALGLKKIVWDYDPSGTVNCMDVFWTGPLVGRVPARDEREWFDGFIGKWKDFVRDVGEMDGDGGGTIAGLKFHFVQGTHRTMISPPHVVGFQKLFKQAMLDRGL
ncbi:uncharacterized protein BP5553_07216 [Venustampulla echinocandica]|uniref:Carrier domain-containing protein n=1 Tax=Venustampulla echinocandica TaxID=2656787 RepID=A0A370TIV0_9HELO|nr:uncharacterized protein BP5553_07216 [Venustampulla echinocandica]RDL35285.1 hypothetical protein BP5553_07216 [Venustampulla echinocandica]